MINLKGKGPGELSEYSETELISFFEKPQSDETYLLILHALEIKGFYGKKSLKNSSI